MSEKAENTEKQETKTQVAEEPANAGCKKKKHRERKRHIFNAIRKQIEFYFGDANLSKDRFMKSLIEKDPYVPIETFLSFNKIKALNATTENIIKSLSNSEILEVDESKTKVRRKTAIPTERNVDHMTLYCEGLPDYANHDWIHKLFEAFGRIAYISLPRYKVSKKIKGFAFIEFENEKSIKRVLKTFETFNGLLDFGSADPGELASIRTYNKEDAGTEQKDKKEQQQQNVVGQKRKCAPPNETETLAKKPKIEGANASATEGSSDDESSSSGSDDDGDNGAASEQTEMEDQNTEATDDVGKKRKRHKKSAGMRRKRRELITDPGFYELKVLPKINWKRLRNKYLNLQREKVGELKRKAAIERQQRLEKNGVKSQNIENENAEQQPPCKKMKPGERKMQKMKMNFYGAGAEEPQQQQQQQQQNLKTSAQATNTNTNKYNRAQERKATFSYEPGIIVEIQFSEPCTNIKEFKEDMRQYPEVKYVDVKEGSVKANLRLDSPKNAEVFIAQKLGCTDYKCQILEGEAEAEYWKKIERDREMKLNKETVVKKKRGRERVKKLIVSSSKPAHIRFDEVDETAET